MQILLTPLIIIFIPITILFFLLQSFKKSRQISISSKIALGLTFIIFGILASLFAMIVSINGMGQEGIKCATGAVAFIPLGFMIHIVGVPLLLILFKNRKSKTVEVQL